MVGLSLITRAGPGTYSEPMLPAATKAVVHRAVLVTCRGKICVRLVGLLIRRDHTLLCTCIWGCALHFAAGSWLQHVVLGLDCQLREDLVQNFFSSVVPSLR